MANVIIQIMEFAEWLKEEMNKKGYNQNTLAKAVGVSDAHINHIVHNRRNPGTELCDGIAHAFKLPPEYVFRKAGLLPPAPERTEQIEILIYLFDKLPEKDKVELLDYMQIKLMMVSK